MVNNSSMTVLLCGSGKSPSKTGMAHWVYNKLHVWKLRLECLRNLPAGYFQNHELPIFSIQNNLLRSIELYPAQMMVFLDTFHFNALNNELQLECQAYRRSNSTRRPSSIDWRIRSRWMKSVFQTRNSTSCIRSGSSI